ncbi:LacI family DNA-binding transcriptional regulator [Alphaproteobacteria bacterium]|nr:LacI family DNA-binding transcriptional regulator [Alphaproteobacteria bacterium]
MKQPSTIKDVAKLAQCGVATVSRLYDAWRQVGFPE